MVLAAKRLAMWAILSREGDNLSVRELSVALQCCGALVEVEFRRSEAPGLPMGLFRKNLVCPGCERLVILSLVDQANRKDLEQEIIII